MWNTLLFNVPWAHRLTRAALTRLRRDDHFLSAEENLTEWCTARITATMRDTGVHQDGSDDHLVKRLSLSKTKTGQPLSTSWVYAEVLDNVSAAQATVTVALTYVLWNLTHHSSWQERIREELAQLPRQGDGFPSFSDINAAPILDACIKESYRLNPLSSGRAERVVPMGKEYDGVFIPPGVRINHFHCHESALQTDFPLRASRPLSPRPRWPYSILLRFFLRLRRTTLADGFKQIQTAYVPCRPITSPSATGPVSAWANPSPL